MAAHLRRILPQRCGSVREVRTQILKRHRTRCTFEIQWRDGRASQALIGKVYAAERGDVFDAMDAVRLAGFGADETFSIPQPLAYDPELNLLLLEKVDGLRAKEVLLSGTPRERVKAAEQCARWLARFQALGPKLGEATRVHDVLEWVDEWFQPFHTANGELAGAANRLREQLEAAAGRLETSELCASHGHFTSGQVLMTEGRPVVVDSAIALGLTGVEVLSEERTVAIDWDDATVADPCLDAASFVVHLNREGLDSPEERAALRQAADVFLKTYLSRRGRHAGRNLPFYAAVRCLRLASRDIEKHNLTRAASMLEEGLRILKDGLSSSA
jgi:aminoglycoside phosphotransferase (APT) family kinase protein